MLRAGHALPKSARDRTQLSGPLVRWVAWFARLASLSALGCPYGNLATSGSSRSIVIGAHESLPKGATILHIPLVDSRGRLSKIGTCLVESRVRNTSPHTTLHKSESVPFFPSFPVTNRRHGWDGRWKPLVIYQLRRWCFLHYSS